MGLKTKLTANFRHGAIGVALTALCGLLFWSWRSSSVLGDGLVRLSYDLPFLFSPKASVDKVLLITADELSYRNLEQDYDKKFDRALHARLLENLKEADVVVFDFFLSDPGSVVSNEALARALKAHGRVVLAARRDQHTI